MSFGARTALSLFVSIVLGLPCAAAAQSTRESPRLGLFELRFTPGYVPDVDSVFNPSAECASARPYQKIFGNDGGPLFQVGASSHLWQGFGALSLGASVGYFSDEGDMVRTNPCVGDGNVTDEEVLYDEDRSATDNTSLTMLPLQAQITYRLNVFENSVPVVPVLRGGLDYFVWWIDDQNGDTAYFDTARDKPAEGGTWGWHWSAGVHFLLDFLAPEMATGFDLDAGVNSSYLLIEYTVMKVDDFGDKNSIRLGKDGILSFGLALEL
jgi:hypothetical protein